ncbi:MAG: hypothetical protein M3315_04820 [Actinomycetota bacterium]|nr:hypothetical protein [Actinomycetota bacterium]
MEPAAKGVLEGFMRDRGVEDYAELAQRAGLDKQEVLAFARSGHPYIARFEGDEMRIVPAIVKGLDLEEDEAARLLTAFFVGVDPVGTPTK